MDDKPRVIQGFGSLFVSGRDVAKFCVAHAKYHQERIAVYQKNLIRLNEAIVEGGGSMDPRAALNAKIAEHTDEANFLEFMSRYIRSEDTYELGANDLRRLGAIKR